MRNYSVIVVNPLEKCAKDDKPAGTLYQYDYGQRLVFGGVELPDAYEVHFSNQRMGNSVTVIGDVTGVDIPDAMLLTGQDIHVWLYLHQGEADGETVYYARIAVRTRAKPTHEEPTPVQQDEITQAIAALNAAVESTEADAAAAEASASAASAAQAAAEAAQDGAENAMRAAEAAQTGAETADAAAEEAKADAESARDRAEAAASVLEDCSAEAETLSPGADATASYSDGVFHFGIPKGAKGNKGDKGDKGDTGDTGPQGETGPQGPAGQDGADGQDGYTPQRGTDYWTAEDQAVIISAVEDAVEPEISEVKSAIDGKAPVISRTASGDIVNISDGADGIPLSSCVVSIDPVQSGTGDPAPDNIRPISGWTGANIYRWGHNAAAPMVIGVAISSTDGHETTASDKATTPFIPVDFDQYPTYLFSGFTDRLRTFIAAYNAKKEFRGRTNAITATEKAITKDYFINAVSNSGPIAYVRLIQYENVNLPGTISEVANLPVQLEPGAAATAYQPYQGQTYAVDWQTAAGTVYGGTLDTVNGVLTVTDGQIASYAGETLPGAWISDRDVYTPGGTPTTGAQVVYKLATPQTVQLSAVEIKALLGENNLWADTGAISLTYPADTQTYVDSAITAATDPDGNVVQVTGTTPSITGESGKRYVCGTVDSISITPPQTGIIDVVFTSGTTPTVLTASGVVWPGWFDPNSLSASTVYDITIKDGYGVVNTWS